MSLINLYLVNITQCRVLNCDFKSYRCKSYYLPILKKILIYKNISINYIIEDNELIIKNLPSNYFLLYLLNKRYINFYKNYILKKYILRHSIWFTKNTNLEKLFVVGFNMFLSSGIILNFLNTPYKFLRRRLKTWYGYINAFFKLFPFSSLLYFTNIFGNKYLLMEKIIKNKYKNIFIFIKFFYLNFIFIKKKKKRIKRWVTKKYYRYLTSI